MKQTCRRVFNVANQKLTALMSGAENIEMGGKGDGQTHCILVIGKAGNGKSSVCNTIVGDARFKTGRSFAATTHTLQVQQVDKYDRRILVVDTPDITNLDLTPDQRQAEVNAWREVTQPYTTTVLLTVRCDVRYTAEEHAIYRQIQRLWGDNSLQQRLVVAFTFGDCQDKPIAEELQTVCPELKSVLADAGQRYFVFSNKAKNTEEQAQKLIRFLDSSLSEANAVPPSPGRPCLFYVPLVLVAVALLSGIGLAASITASQPAGSAVFGVLFFAAGLALIGLKVWNVHKGLKT